MSDHENCQVDPLEKSLDVEALATAEAAFLGVSGMGCPTCAMRVRNGLLSLGGVLYANVFLENSVAAVAFDPARVTVDNLVLSVARAGNDGRHNYQAHILQTMPANEAFTIVS